MNNTQNSIRDFWKQISWLTIILAILTIVSFVVLSSTNRQYSIPMGTRGVVMENAGISGAMPPTAGVQMKNIGDTSYSEQDALSLSYPYPYQNPDVPITDTRELLKVYYNASMRTRDVQGLTGRVVTTVRGYDGRIDQESSSPRYGSVSFALPEGKYDALRAELEGLVRNRFLVTNISSQNLLPQKLSIEQQQEKADSALSEYITAREKLVDTHESAVSSLQSEIDAVEKQLTALRLKPQSSEVFAQIEALTKELSTLKRRLTNSNASYEAQLKYADKRIKSAEDWQKAVQTQDKTLLDNVATVTGTVSIQWISVIDIILLYLPGYSISGIFAVLTLLSFLRDHRKIDTV